MKQKEMIKGTLKIAAYDEWYDPFYACPYCGDEHIWDDFKFCPLCGRTLVDFSFEESDGTIEI